MLNHTFQNTYNHLIIVDVAIQKTQIPNQNLLCTRCRICYGTVILHGLQYIPHVHSKKSMQEFKCKISQEILTLHYLKLLHLCTTGKGLPLVAIYIAI